MYLEMHALHTLPYSNVNRDGLGSPKSCFYGGTQRIRVSSQSWKRSARLVVESRLETPTIRTRQIAQTVGARLVEEHGWGEDDARRAGRAILHAYKQPPSDASDDTSVLLWLPSTVVTELAQLAIDNRDVITSIPLPEVDAKGKVKKQSKEDKAASDVSIRAAVATMAAPASEILNSRNPTIALLGRMLANTPDHTVDGATQVAHAFTIHEAAPDFDYFTAVDDCAKNSGAGHLATAEFATGTFYRYCNINIRQLVDQLGDVDTALSLAEAWAQAFLTIVPSGKKNSTAPATAPDLVHLAVRAAPLSLAPAFEKTVPTGPYGFVDRGCTVLADYAEGMHRFLGDAGHWTGYASPRTTTFPALGEHHNSLGELIQAAGNTILDRMQPEAAA